MVRATVFALLSVVTGEEFPDVLVDVPYQPRVAADLVGTILQVPSWNLLENHLHELGSTPSFTKHMNVLRGDSAVTDVASLLDKEIGLGMTVNELNQCAEDSSCLNVWKTDSSLMARAVRITGVVGSWNMTEAGVGNVCHVQKQKDAIFCHRPGDAYKTGLSWLAMGVPADAPTKTPLPVAVRCHDKGPSANDAPCHLLAGHEFMAARSNHIHVGEPSMFDSSTSSSKTLVVPLGWCSDCSPHKVQSGGIRAGALTYIGFAPPAEWWGLCLDVDGATSVNGAKVQMWHCENGAPSQKWHYDGKLRFTGDGLGTHCLDIPGGDVKVKAEPWLWECYDESPVQAWDIRLLSQESARVGNKAEQNQLALTVDGQDWCLSFSKLAGENYWTHGNRINGSTPYLNYCHAMDDADIFDSHQRWTYAHDVVDSLV